MTTASIAPVTPKDALNALFARGANLLPSFHWQDVEANEHASGLTVARSAGFDVLGDIYDGLLKLVQDGQTIAQATKDLTPILQAKGWWGKQWTTDPKTGERVVSQLGSVARLQTIFDANLRVSYASGHWTQFQANKAVRPYLIYGGIDDTHTRPSHRAHFGLCLPVDDPYWDVWAPPCGWHCRCNLKSLSEGDVKRFQGKIFFTPPSIPNRVWTNKRTGEVSTLPEGIDPGWGHNPGKLGSQAATAYAEKLATAPVPIAAAAVSDKSWPAAKLADEFEVWANALREREAGGRPDVTQSARVVGGLTTEIIDKLATIGIAPETAAITAGQKEIYHALRASKEARDQAVPTNYIARMPEFLSKPDAVLWSKNTGSLTYVFNAGPRWAKLAYKINIRAKVPTDDGKTVRAVTNGFVTAGLLDLNNLTDTNDFVLLVGKLIE